MSGTLMLGVGVLGIGTAIQPAACVEDLSGWISSYEAGKAAARQAGRPIFLVFR
jgi:hypothetical protein